MALATGTKAPDFSLPTKTADGPKQIKLSENFGKKNTLLLFFPMAFTGTCTNGDVRNEPGAERLWRAECGCLRDQRRQPVRAGSMGAEGKITGFVLSDYEHRIAKNS